jgi:tRNA G18 (ribose-2'-O)-methylase SpoU
MFAHQRHKSPTALAQPRPLVLALPALRSNVNISRIARAAACCGVSRIVTCGKPRLDPKIARDAASSIELELHRTLAPALGPYRSAGYQLVALEQATGAENLHRFAFRRRTVLVVGHERQGVGEQTLGLVDCVVEIPVYGLPYSYNVATATAMALYEYCRQYPEG